MPDLYPLVEHVRRKGEAKAVCRLGLRVLMDASEEGIAISLVTKSTECSPALYDKVKAEAEAILGERIGSL